MKKYTGTLYVTGFLPVEIEDSDLTEEEAKAELERDPAKYATGKIEAVVSYGTWETFTAEDGEEEP
jgi:hypothetical protein